MRKPRWWSLSSPDPVSRAVAVRMSWSVWGVFLVAACIVSVSIQQGLPVNEEYAHGALRWLSGETLYNGGTGFIYLPQSALVYIPFRLLPSALEQILWRSVTISLFALGVYRLSAVGQGASQLAFFPLVSLLVLPKTWTLAVNGQATPAMAGLLMAAVAALHQKKWWPATGLLVLALAFKPLAIVFLLLAGGVYPTMRGRLAVGLTLFFAVPYGFGDCGYVTRQYVSSVAMFGDAVKLGYVPEWAQIFSLAHLLGFEVSAFCQTALRLAFAVSTLLLARHVDRGAARPETRLHQDLPASLSVYALATVYLMLFNPRTENSFYLVLSPVLGVFCAHALFVERRTLKAALLAAAAVLLVAGHEICQVLTPAAGFVWICPVVCLAFAAVTWSGDWNLTDGCSDLSITSDADRGVPTPSHDR